MRARQFFTLPAAAGVVAALSLSAVPAQADIVYCNGHRATIVGTGGDDVIHGTSGRDVIAGLNGNDTIYGGGGDDLICGARGTDRIYGGRGDDKLRGGLDGISVTEEETSKTGDSLRGGPGDDVLLSGPDSRQADDVNPDAILWDTAPGPMRIDVAAGTATGQGHDTFFAPGSWFVGSAYGDTVLGSTEGDRLNGGPGSDVIRGRAGDDRIIADLGKGQHYNDVVYGGAGDDEISAGRGQDRLYGGDGDDVIDDFGNSGDVLAGGAGADLLIGEIVRTEQEQRYSGGAGVDRVSLFTNLVNPTVEASTGQWNMQSGVMTLNLGTPIILTVEDIESGDLSTYGTAWNVTGTDGDDTLTAAGTSGTTFHGLVGDDTFMGSTFDDLFDGGPGTDHSLGMGENGANDDSDTCISVEVFDVADCENVSA
jgi:Ca2+-binding RTX toxin-like protein